MRDATMGTRMPNPRSASASDAGAAPNTDAEAPARAGAGFEVAVAVVVLFDEVTNRAVDCSAINVPRRHAQSRFPVALQVAENRRSTRPQDHADWHKRAISRSVNLEALKRQVVNVAELIRTERALGGTRPWSRRMVNTWL